MIGRDALEPADRDRFAVDPAAATRRLARSVAGASKNARKDVGFAVEQIRFAVSPLGDQTDVLGNVRVGRAGPLAVHHFVVVLRVGNVRWSAGHDRRNRHDGTTGCRHTWLLYRAEAVAYHPTRTRGGQGVFPYRPIAPRFVVCKLPVSTELEEAR